jgi:hypothetical protein
MKRKQLEPSIKFIPVGNNEMYVVSQLREIDINDLEGYTVRQLISIFGQKMTGARKKDYIKAILSSKKSQIVSDNREIKLNKLLSK